jgi:hypothetical protein
MSHDWGGFDLGPPFYFGLLMLQVIAKRLDTTMDRLPIRVEIGSWAMRDQHTLASKRPVQNTARDEYQLHTPLTICPGFEHQDPRPNCQL